MANAQILNRAISLLAELVRFDSTSCKSNLEIISFIEQYLRAHDVRTERYDHVPGQKTNLWGMIGPERVGGVLLSGHTDTVPAIWSEWSSDPHLLTEKNGCLFGRGTCDMKGFLAVVLAMVPEFRGSGLRLPVHLAFSCDEEIGCAGVLPLIDGIAKLPFAPSKVIVGEPTGMKVVNAQKGVLAFATEVLGVEAHASRPGDGVSAIYAASAVVSKLMALAYEFASRPRTQMAFSPSYTTINVGTISGGTAENVVPGKARLVWEVRPASADDVKHILAELSSSTQQLSDENRHRLTISTELLSDVPGLDPAPDSSALSLALKLSATSSIQAVSYATEAGHFQKAGFDTVICGPGSIDQAHKPDEHIHVQQLASCIDFMMALADFLSGDGVVCGDAVVSQSLQSVCSQP